MQRWDNSVEIAQGRVLKNLETVVSSEIYNEDEGNFNGFNNIIEYCTKKRAPKEETDGDKFLGYEMEKHYQSYQKDLGGEMVDMIVEDMAKEMVQIQKKRLHLKKQDYY